LSSETAGSPSTVATAVRAEASIVANDALGSAGYRLRLEVPDWPASAPGQFLMVSPGAVGGVPRQDPLLPRPMAVYLDKPAGTAGASVEILYKVEGRGTALLAEADPGERLLVVGPLGQPFPVPPKGGRVVIVGGGTGVASLYALARDAASSAEVTVILGARAAGDLLGREDFEALDVTLLLTTEDGSLGECGRVTAPLERLLAAGGVDRLYSCGPTPMMRACAELAAEHGVACSVSLENNMACGFGVCLGCAAPRAAGAYALVCRDGPVFEATEIDWEGMP
jgi:dihydroorotate dehydrogenase electron transfer subunit